MKMSSAKQLPFCFALSVLRYQFGSKMVIKWYDVSFKPQWINRKSYVHDNFDALEITFVCPALKWVGESHL